MMVMSMRVPMVMRAVIMVVVMPVMMIMSVIMRRGGIRATTQQPQESATLDPQQAQANQHDQGITDDLDNADCVTHCFGSGAQHGCSNADNGDGGECLKDRGRKRQHNAAPPGFIIGDQIGRDDRLAMAGTGSVEDAVEK